MSVDKVRNSAGTKIGDAVGAAVRAATSAGDRIRDPAAQPPTDDTTTAPRNKLARVRRFMSLSCVRAQDLECDLGRDVGHKLDVAVVVDRSDRPLFTLEFGQGCLSVR